MRAFIAIFLVTLAVTHGHITPTRCELHLRAAGFSANFNETIAHAIHSMTVQGLQLFNPRANEKNTIPTVNLNLHDKSGVKVLMRAPNDPLPSDYFGFAMNLIDQILSMIGKSDDEVGELTPKPTDTICKCILDVQSNGILQAVQWIAAHYESGTPITLMDRPIPKLVDSITWARWKADLLHYYTPEGLRDAATYLYCATKDF